MPFDLCNADGIFAPIERETPRHRLCRIAETYLTFYSSIGKLECIEAVADLIHLASASGVDIERVLIQDVQRYEETSRNPVQALRILENQ